MFFNRTLITFLAMALAVTGFAAPITTLHNTGGGPEGTVDPNYTVWDVGALGRTQAQIAACGNHPLHCSGSMGQDDWPHNNAQSKWVTAKLPLAPVSLGLREYATDFMVANPFQSFEIMGKVMSDGAVISMQLNSTYAPASMLSQYFDQWTSFTFTQGLVVGMNRLVFVVQNLGYTEGLRVEVSGTTMPDPPKETPEVASLWYLFSGAAFFVFRKRRRLQT